MIAIIDYGVGNLYSLRSSLKAIGVDAEITSDKEKIMGADKLILPGVGAFKDARAKLSENGLDKLIIALAKEGNPIMGICLGMQMLFERSYEYGVSEGLGLLKGSVVPMENYIDMRSHTKVGYYKSTVKDQYVPYPKPQEHGNHTCTSYVSVADRHHLALTFSSDNEFEFNASHYSSEQLTYATHTNDIGDKNKTIVRIDYKVSGIGSNSCGPELLPKYQLNEKKIHYSFNVKPVI